MTFLDSLRIFRTAEAKALAGDLFREQFNAEFPVPRMDAGLSIATPPENWRQYVAVYRWPEREEAVGFCNWIKHQDVYLEGGMCVRAGFYRRLPRPQFQECSAAGGVAQLMMEHAARELTDCKAWFGYCGDPKAMAVDLRFGYEKTRFPFLIVKWFQHMESDDREALVEKIARIGPF